MGKRRAGAPVWHYRRSRFFLCSYPSKPYMDWKIEADRYLLVQKADGLTLPPEPWADVVNVETRLNPPDLWHRQCLAHLGQPTERRKKQAFDEAAEALIGDAVGKHGDYVWRIY